MCENELEVKIDCKWENADSLGYILRINILKPSTQGTPSFPSAQQKGVYPYAPADCKDEGAKASLEESAVRSKAVANFMVIIKKSEGEISTMASRCVAK